MNKYQIFYNQVMNNYSRSFMISFCSKVGIYLPSTSYLRKSLLAHYITEYFEEKYGLNSN
jgi:hypothetical protein